jgi:hypothetical protein
MYLDLCLLSCDLNSTYYDFFPLIKSYWKKIVGIDCILILVAKEVPYSLLPEKDSIILFPPIPNIPTAFQAQCIRLLYPCLLNFNGIIISDMDIIPLNNNFFSKPIEPLTQQNTFCIYRNVIADYKQYPMCYCAGSSDVWRKLFKINIMNDLIETLTSWYSKDDYTISSASSEMWAQDQLQLFKVVELPPLDIDIVKFTDDQTHFTRLDRSQVDYIKDNVMDIKTQIQEGKYSDFHLPRPFTAYKDLLEFLLLA